MKKFTFTLLVLIIGLSGIAQYKKASYFGKAGRLYGLGTRFYMLGDYSGTVRGYTFSVARDQDGKQWFVGYDFQYIPSYSVQLTAWNSSTGGYTGGNFSTKAQLIYTYNVGYFLLKNDDADRKIKPYLSAAIGVKLMGGIKDAEDEDIAADLPFSMNANGGAGLIWYVQPWLGLKAEGGYSYQKAFGSEGKDYALPKHPYVSAGLIFRIVGK
jgi:hypothetical protein